ncbi:MAG: class I SAM-dependent methyltransferase [Nitrospinota bacterium]|nr:class I SAM-dependent methyltransferase [Nitrospinota bacterium]
MKKNEYKKMFAEEQTHWFFTAKRKFITAFLHNVPLVNDPLIFDAGCGTGANHLFLQKYGRVISADLSEEALVFCRQRDLCGLVCSNLNIMCFKNEAFDMIAALDVLYHAWVTDDLALLHEFYRTLKPKGKLLITDSAFPFLTSCHDKAVMTRERYTIPVLSDKLVQAGFTVYRASYMFAATFPLVVTVRLLQRFFQGDHEESNVFPVPEPINTLILKIMSLEAALLRHAHLPFGSSLIILAEKPV